MYISFSFAPYVVRNVIKLMINIFIFVNLYLIRIYCVEMFFFKQSMCPIGSRNNSFSASLSSFNVSNYYSHENPFSTFVESCNMSNGESHEVTVRWKWKQRRTPTAPPRTHAPTKTKAKTSSRATLRIPHRTCERASGAPPTAAFHEPRFTYRTECTPRPSIWHVFHSH